jgi:hypothetical protein
MPLRPLVKVSLLRNIGHYGKTRSKQQNAVTLQGGILAPKDTNLA